MIATKGIPLKKIIAWSWHHVVWLNLASFIIALLYREGIISIKLPWLPISVIGTAVAFYIGFKNNQAYDRMWEARKIWGAMVNSSRAWGSYVDGFITNQFTDNKKTTDELHQLKEGLIYRHIAWLYALRSQLLVPAPWEHVNQGGQIARTARMYQDKFGVGLVSDEVTQIELHRFLPEKDYERLVNAKNTATQIINDQSKDLRELRSHGLIDDFRHMEMQKLLYDLYEHQGKCERIKKFPLPRQYANMSRYFVGIFLCLLPFSLIPELMQAAGLGFWLSIPVTALVGWVYVMMEVVGDYSENPFQGMANDIPMLSLCRVIETDLREILNETDLPAPIEIKEGVLM